MGASRGRRRLRVTGVVQGVGFRPFVYRLAHQLGLAGHVGNDRHGVFIEVEGPPGVLDDFAARVRSDAPSLARVESVVAEDVPVRGERTFSVAPSADSEGADLPVALVPPDTACCPDCLRETFDPDDRRYRYPFTACTYCGPRFTMVTGIPYDRPSTTMAGFPLCDDCAREYEDPGDRRFHAQPTACPVCGPSLTFRTSDGRSQRGEAALAAAAALLREGGIVAVKGVGGYHLACDATRPEVVDRLRTRKHRSAKPLAVVVPDVAAARRLAEVDVTAEAELCSPAAPIVLLPVADDPAARRVAASVAPGAGTIGVLLSYTPLLHLLVEQPLVLTSGNLADEPICTDPQEAELRLSAVADGWLHHDRPIHVACDDSVVRVSGGSVQPVRRSRGYAPLPVRLPFSVPPVLAAGGELKATVCLAHGERAWMSQHLGDVATLETLDMLGRAVDVLTSLAGVRPEVVVADQHPGYLSQRWALERAVALGARAVLVQHHHAHLASLLAEHQVPPGRPVIGFAFDGTGFGPDGTIWGGEVLLGSYDQVDRVGHLRPVMLPGGDAAVRRPARVALAHLSAAGLAWDPGLPTVRAAGSVERRVVAAMVASGSGCTPTTSMGRLFDAVASLTGVCQDAGYEGQAAVELEAVSALATTAGPPPHGSRMTVTDDLVLDPSPVLARCVADVSSGVPAGDVGLVFHESVAAGVLEVARRLRATTGVDTVGLTGGVFQNALLTRLSRAGLEEAGFTVLVHRTVPPNDGGLALGQVAVAAHGGGKEVG